MATIYIRNTGIVITAITQANPAKVTTATAHGLSTGNIVGIAGVVGMTQVNNLAFTITVVDSTSFTLGVDSTGYSAYGASGYSGGGMVYPSPGSGSYRGPWLPSTAFVSGDRVISNTVTSSRMHECTTDGTSGAAQPTFNTSAGGTTADNTVTWTTRESDSKSNATISLTRIGSVANDIYYVASDHYEIGSTTSIVTLFQGSGFICTSINWNTDAYEAGATFAGLSSVRGCYVSNANGAVICGVQFIAGIRSTAIVYIENGYGTQSYIFFKDCSFVLGTTSTSTTGTNTSTNTVHTYSIYAKYVNCTFKLTHANHSYTISSDGIGNFINCTFDTSAAVPTLLFSVMSRPTTTFTNCDFSAMTGTTFYPTNSTYYYASFVYKNCKFPTNAISTTTALGYGYAGRNVYNYLTSPDIYNFARTSPQGTTSTNTTYYRSGGATDGTTPICWAMYNTNSYTNYGEMAAVQSPEIIQWNTATGSPLTVTLQLLRNSATALTDKNFWIEVQYQGTASSIVGSYLTTKNSAASAANNLSTSSETWTTTGMANPNKQYVTATFTPQSAGYIVVTAYFAVSGSTVYIDPKITIA